MVFKSLVYTLLLTFCAENSTAFDSNFVPKAVNDITNKLYDSPMLANMKAIIPMNHYRRILKNDNPLESDDIFERDCDTDKEC